jgi:hypothetical protein
MKRRGGRGFLLNVFRKEEMISLLYSELLTPCISLRVKMLSQVTWGWQWHRACVASRVTHSQWIHILKGCILKIILFCLLSLIACTDAHVLSYQKNALSSIQYIIVNATASWNSSYLTVSVLRSVYLCKSDTWLNCNSHKAARQKLQLSCLDFHIYCL